MVGENSRSKRSASSELLNAISNPMLLYPPREVEIDRPNVMSGEPQPHLGETLAEINSGGLFDVDDDRR